MESKIFGADLQERLCFGFATEPIIAIHRSSHLLI
jgi:hypothetical protein